VSACGFIFHCQGCPPVSSSSRTLEYVDIISPIVFYGSGVDEPSPIHIKIVKIHPNFIENGKKRYGSSW
jgi:hypothetical protein